MAKSITFETVQDLSATVIVKFQEGLEGYKPVYSTVAPTIKSNGTSNIYPLGDLPVLKEWVEGEDRELKKIKESQYSLVNKKFEATLEIPRTALEDDAYGFYIYQANALGKEAAQHPDKLLADLITDGFSTGKGYDEVSFFNASHQLKTGVQSNVIAGAEEPWVLVDMSKSMPAFFHQERLPYTIEKPADLSETTFIKDKYLFGVRGRGAFGYGLHQLAVGAKVDLNEANFEKAVDMLLNIKKYNGNMVGANPTHIIVGPKNYIKAQKLFKQAFANATSNIWLNQIQVVFLPFISTASSSPASRQVDDATSTSNANSKPNKNNQNGVDEQQEATDNANNESEDFTKAKAEVLERKDNVVTIKFFNHTFDIASNQIRDDGTLTGGALAKFMELKGK